MARIGWVNTLIESNPEWATSETNIMKEREVIGKLNFFPRWQEPISVVQSMMVFMVRVCLLGNDFQIPKILHNIHRCGVRSTHCDSIFHLVIK